MYAEDWIMMVAGVGICLVFALIGVAAYKDITEWEPQRQAAHEAECAAKGLKPASFSERHGKTSTTVRFCVDANGVVYWP